MRSLVFSVVSLIVVLLSGCMTSVYEIRQLETTYLNEEADREYIQKNAVLLETGTGKTWVFSSDENSNYRWVEVPVTN